MGSDVCTRLIRIVFITCLTARKIAGGITQNRKWLNGQITLLSLTLTKNSNCFSLSIA